MGIKAVAAKVVVTTVLLCCAGSFGEDKVFNQAYRDAVDLIMARCPVRDYTMPRNPPISKSDTGIAFNCQHYDHPNPASTVHELTPYDIKVIGAMGDSITAAFGGAADKFIQLFEYWGVSWSIGGDETVETVGTLANILRKYNPDIIGYSVGHGLKSDPRSGLNVARSGAVAQDMPFQAQELVYKIKTDSNIDSDNDWKLVTLFIGGNNLCKYCNDTEYNSVENYITNLIQALDTLHFQLPKTFVNLVLILDVTVVAPLKDTSCICKFIHAIACPCAEDEPTSQAATAYQNAVERLIDSGRYEEDDFTVVIQPLFVDMELPLKDDGSGEPDVSYFAPDCFHFSEKGHREAAVALWNNMFQPIGSKQTVWELNGNIICPNQVIPYLYTKENSHVVAQPIKPHRQ